ncbi:YigZ family protein [Micrococcus sp.]|uniref:IMPACT family protein n=1 Tax=Micrococcus sp. TaxID=1271 RepID=UPI002A90EAE1|nr:YigZ family protein [Micrococcus sp.]MDY6054439.1 YigZ family protein [Micrococcus sp.]
MPTDDAPRCTVLSPTAAHPDGWVVHEEEVRRSRFMAVLARVEQEEQAREVVATLRRRHHDSRHVCSAWILGPDRGRMRSNDDGEPAGTAGVPMLEALALRETGPGRADLTDVAAVVVRWFGGVKLGAGGLVRAYSDAVSRALDEAVLLTRVRTARLEIPAPHAEAGRWQHELELAGVPVTDARYGAEGVTLIADVPDSPARVAAAHAAVARISGGTAQAQPAGHGWTDLPAS